MPAEESEPIRDQDPKTERAVRLDYVANGCILAAATVAIGVSLIANGVVSSSHPLLFLILLVLTLLAKLLKIEVQRDVFMYCQLPPLFIAAVLLSPAEAAIIAALGVAAREFYIRRLIPRLRTVFLKSRDRHSLNFTHRLILWLVEPLVPVGALPKYGSNAGTDPESSEAAAQTARPDKVIILEDLVVLPVLHAFVPGVLFHYFAGVFGIGENSGLFYLLFAGVFFLAIIINFLYYEAIDTLVEGHKFGSGISVLRSLLPLEFVTIAVSTGAVFLYYAAASNSAELVLITLVLAAMLVAYWRIQYARVTRERVTFGGLANLTLRLAKRHHATGTHMAAVARYAFVVARRTGLSFKEQRLAYQAGLIHDAGKVEWPGPLLDGTITKPTDEDWELMKKHPETAAEWLEAIGEDELAEVVLYHHVNEDGQHSYPEGLDHSAMPEVSKIIHVVDTFDVLTARDTIYTQPRSPQEAFEELERCSALCPEDERTDDYRGRPWFEMFTSRYVTMLEEAWYEEPELGFNHTERQDFEDALDFYKNGLRPHVRRAPRRGGAHGQITPRKA